MSTPVFKIWMTRPTSAWYDLSETEINELFKKDSKTFDEVGGRNIVHCRGFWSNERWPFFGVELFPNSSALQKHCDILESIGWSKVSEAQAFIGVSGTPVTPVDPKSGGMYKLFIGRMTEAAYQLGKTAQDQAMEQLSAYMKENGVTSMVMGELISSQRQTFFGLEHYPSFDAVVSYRKCLDEMDWFRYIEAEILLGTIML